MFIGIEFNDLNGSRYFERLNVSHITRLSFVNIKNPDAGTLIYLRTGETLKTIMPMDVLSEVIDEAWERAASVVLMTIINEKLDISITEVSSKEDLPEE
jgi:hypothetical protein